MNASTPAVTCLYCTNATMSNMCLPLCCNCQPDCATTTLKTQRSLPLLKFTKARMSTLPVACKALVKLGLKKKSTGKAVETTHWVPSVFGALSKNSSVPLPLSPALASAGSLKAVSHGVCVFLFHISSPAVFLLLPTNLHSHKWIFTFFFCLWFHLLHR